MDKEKLKLLIRNLELVVDNIKAEVYSDASSYTNPNVGKQPLLDYDEIFDEHYGE